MLKFSVIVFIFVIVVVYVEFKEYLIYLADKRLEDTIKRNQHIQASKQYKMWCKDLKEKELIKK